MIPLPLSWNAPLGSTSRCAVALPGPADEIGAVGWRDVAAIVGAGVATALCANLLDGGLKIPGHAILRSVLPMTLGIALVPRRLSGTLIGGIALVATILLHGLGFETAGAGARTSMLLIGPAMDLALWFTRGGWWVYGQCALGGLAANMVAFLVRSGDAGGGGVGRPILLGIPWQLGAPWSYALCGALAGLVSAALWFHWTTPDPPATEEPPRA